MKENIESLISKPRIDSSGTEEFLPYNGEGHPSLRLVVSRMLYPLETAVILGDGARRTFEAIDGHLNDQAEIGDGCTEMVRELVKFY